MLEHAFLYPLSLLDLFLKPRAHVNAQREKVKSFLIGKTICVKCHAK